MNSGLSRPEGFDEQLVALQPSLLRFAITMTRNHSKAEDLTQSVILLALRKFELFEVGTNLRAWLFTILRNEFYSAVRKSGREVSDPDGQFAAAVPVNEGQTWAYDLKVVRKRMRMLNSVQRRSFELVAVQQFAYEEAAEMLGILVGTVKSQVSRARDFLDTGDVSLLAPPILPPAPEPQTPDSSVGDQIGQLYISGASVSEIQAAVAGVSRSEIMSVVLARKLRRK